MFAFMEHIPGCADWVGCCETGVSQSPVLTALFLAVWGRFFLVGGGWVGWLVACI